MSGATVLYDEPGPRARRRITLVTVLVLAAAAALVVVAVLRLNSSGQFDAARWSPLFNPGDDDFGAVWQRLGEGGLITLEAAALAMGLSLVLGTLMAVGRLVLGRGGRIPLVVVLELLRGTPVVIAIFFSYRVLPELGLNLSLFWYLVIGLVGYNSVIIAEIVRTGVVSLPRGQSEAASAIGLSRWQSLRLVELPQAFRVMLPALISQLVVIVKDTSLAAFIGLLELLRTGGLLIQTLRNPLQTYLLIGLLYIAFNYALSRLAIWTERRMSRSRTGEADADDQAAAKETEQRTGAAAGG